ncbi:MAG TPA: phosphate/phosphite/phosphonate ABC transporter substrate-binding protein [Anaerolineae bacterium]|nr:phosphate/phosphite/phosphonate ABC transporter substrate-binding protein [Anaerolineae bacterium]
MTFSRYLYLILLLAFLTACGGSSPTNTPTNTPPPPTGRPLVLGDISDEPIETIAGTQPIADYLATQLATYGISHGEVKIAPDLDTMITMIETGEVDIYFDSPYPVLVISDATDAEPILRRFKYGVTEYHTVFFVAQDSPITSLDELNGHMIAFEESFSTSGYMLPLSYLIENDYNPTLKPAPDAIINDDEIGYTFSTADDTTIQWVVSGRVTAGAIDNVTLGRLPPETQEQLRVIAATGDVPRQLVLVRPGLDPNLVTAIHDELLTMDENEAGQAALEAFLTTQFDEFPEGATIALQRMRELYELVQLSDQ